MTASRRNSFAAPLAFAVALASAACGGQNDATAPVLDTPARGGAANDGGATANGGTVGDGGVANGGAANGGSSTTDGGAANGGASTTDGGAANGGAPTTDGGSAGTNEPETPHVCPSVIALGAAASLALSTPGDAVFGAIIPDERALAWTTNGASVSVHYAARADRDQPFGEPRTRAIAAAPGGVALSADGLELVFVRADRKGFTALTRAALDDDFDAESDADFALLNAPDPPLAADELYGDPVLDASGLGFYFSLSAAGQPTAILHSPRFSPFAPFGPATRIPLAPALAATTSAGFAPSGVSSDGFTLFLWDAATAHELAASFDSTLGAFQSAGDLGAAHGAAPNGDCTRLYAASGALTVQSITR